MFSLTSYLRLASCLVLLCTAIVVLVWAVPLLTDVLQGSLGGWPMNPGQEAADPADSHTHAFDAPDEPPLILVPIGSTTWQPIVSSLQLTDPTVWAWSPRPPVRPPIALNSI